MMGHFLKVCKRNNLKVNADKRKGIALKGGEGPVSDPSVDVREPEFFRFVLSE